MIRLPSTFPSLFLAAGTIWSAMFGSSTLTVTLASFSTASVKPTVTVLIPLGTYSGVMIGSPPSSGTSTTTSGSSKPRWNWMSVRCWTLPASAAPVPWSDTETGTV